MIASPGRAWPAAPLLAVVLLFTGCGVDSEDTPRPIDDATPESGTTPSVDTRPAPTPTVSPPPPSPASSSQPSTVAASSTPA